jgi:hypothetical protein
MTEGITISSGTLRSGDLIAAYLDHLFTDYHDEIFIPAALARTLRHYEEEVFTLTLQSRAGIISKTAYETSLDALFDELHEELVPHMHNAAPEGTYFGSHEGDAALIGYWPVELEEVA